MMKERLLGKLWGGMRMSKERLEEIVHKEAYLEGTNDLVMVINTDDYRWLIEQAERVQELESVLNKQVEIGYKFEGEVHDLVEQNKHYREAIENVRDELLIHYRMGGSSDNDALMMLDEALEGELDERN